MTSKVAMQFLNATAVQFLVGAVLFLVASILFLVPWNGSQNYRNASELAAWLFIAGSALFFFGGVTNRSRVGHSRNYEQAVGGKDEQFRRAPAYEILVVACSEGSNVAAFGVAVPDYVEYRNEKNHSQTEEGPLQLA
eukprot:CAMPEP_0177595718 /NCGR_PEP_ID=MMETSP0419_2-20121207/10536_1 /TAXON_ID=582737 /ORGANISM="Tetraselmis sp., Strain GSL018" /LENGTH=136 /DNA_ID=CAMNT_0019087257 /DNA_START=982 /DNA_END=1392 /DNA_ORIENTATION=+